MAASVITLILLIFGLCYLPANSLRMFERRSYLADTLPSIPLEWVLPVEGGGFCLDSDDDCEPSLSLPGPEKTLAAVAIGHGSFNYTCEGTEAANGPVFVEQFTNLYDALPLFLDGFNEGDFHALIQAMYEHDYPSLKNTSLECTGSIGTFNGTAVVILSEIDTFEANIEETVPAPDHPGANGLWAHSRSLEDDWEMYRVEMVGGLVPTTCESLDSTFDIPYAAGYWFYHS